MIVLFLVTEKELLLVSAKKESELETLQKIIMSSILQLRKKNKQIEGLKQSLIGNWH